MHWICAASPALPLTRLLPPFVVRLAEDESCTRFDFHRFGVGGARRIADGPWR